MVRFIWDNIALFICSSSTSQDCVTMGLLTVPFAIGLVFLGCCTNVVFLELIIRWEICIFIKFYPKIVVCFICREEPGAGNIITFFQFLFVAVEGFFFVSNCCQKPSKIPMKSYMVLVGLYFTVSVVNNIAFEFDIPLPLHMIFRAVRCSVISMQNYKIYSTFDLLHLANALIPPCSRLIFDTVLQLLRCLRIIHINLQITILWLLEDWCVPLKCIVDL